MSGNKGFRAKGDPPTACHVHDGSDGSMAGAMQKAARDVTAPNKTIRNKSDQEFAETENMDGVPILSVGGPYKGSGSPDEGDHFDIDFLNTLAAANNELAHEIKVPIKLGHSKSQRLLKNSGLWADEMPAAGWVENLRVSGDKLLADLRGVPSKLAELIKLGAFRTRSVELSSVTSQTRDGKEYDTVVTGLALLGAKAPAVRTLDDIYAFYSDAKRANMTLFYQDQDDAPEGRTIDYSEEWTLAEHESGDENQNPVERRHTFPMSDNTTGEKRELTAEMIDEAAKLFGIEEEDADKRHAAVLAAFAEHAPLPVLTPAVTDDTPEPAPVVVAAAPVAGAVALSESDRETVAEEARKTARDYAEAESKRSKVSANIAVALRQGRILPASTEKWQKFFSDNYDLALDSLLAQPPQPKLIASYGSDESGNDPHSGRAEDHFREFAAMTGVPYREEKK